MPPPSPVGRPHDLLIATAVRLTSPNVNPDTGAGHACSRVVFILNYDLHDLVCLPARGQARFTRIDELVLIEAQDNYSQATLADGVVLRLRRTLKYWQHVLPATHFVRVHRAAIVNLERVVSYERCADEQLRLFLRGRESPVLASRRKAGLLRRRLVALRPVL